MGVTVEFPLDEDGYLDRECPNCETQFRWRHGVDVREGSGAADLTQYYCPYCGVAAEADQWWTQEQVEYLQARAIEGVIPEISERLRGWATFEPSGHPMPAPLFVRDLPLTTVASPCHPEEPVKLIDGWRNPLSCLSCGAEYVI